MERIKRRKLSYQLTRNILSLLEDYTDENSTAVSDRNGNRSVEPLVRLDAMIQDCLKEADKKLKDPDLGTLEELASRLTIDLFLVLIREDWVPEDPVQVLPQLEETIKSTLRDQLLQE